MKADTTIPVVPIKVDRDKVARANAVVAMFEAGKVFIPYEAGWRGEWEMEHEVFPLGAHDDLVDTTVHFLNWVRQHATPTVGLQMAPMKSRWRD